MEGWKKVMVCMVAVVLFVGVLGVASMLKNAKLKESAQNGAVMKIGNVKEGQTMPIELDAKANEQPAYMSEMGSNSQPEISDTVDSNHDGQLDQASAISSYKAMDVEGQAKAYPNPWETGTSQDASIDSKKDPTWDETKIQDNGYGRNVGYDTSMLGTAQGQLVTGNPLEKAVTPGNPVTMPKLQDNKNPLDSMDTWFDGTKETKNIAAEHKPVLFTKLSDIGNKEFDTKNTSKSWTWTETINTSEMDKALKNGRIYYKAVGTYTDADGKIEYTLVVVREAVADVKNGSWTYLYGYQGGNEQFVNTTGGKVLYEGVGCWQLRITDGNADGKFDSMGLVFNGYQVIDINEDGKNEFVRNASAEAIVYDNSSNGKAEFAAAYLAVYQAWDGDGDSTPEYQGALGLGFLATDPTDDGNVDSMKILLWGYECWTPTEKKAEDGKLIPKAQRGIVLGFNATDSDSDGTNDAGQAFFAGFAATDNNTDGNPERVAALALLYSGSEPMADKQMANQTLVLWGFDLRDENSDGKFEEQKAALIVYSTSDPSHMGKVTKQDAFVAGAYVRDMNGNGYNESAGIFVGAFESVDANADGNPEKQSAFAWGYEYADANEDKKPEWQRAVVIAFGQNDTNSNGHFENKYALFAGYESYDNNSDGKFGYEALLLAGYNYTDSNDDGNPEHEQAFVLGYMKKDPNEDGNPELEKVLIANVECFDNNSNGIREKNITTIAYYEGLDNNSDGTKDHELFALVHYEGLDTNEDGKMDNETIIVKVVEIP